MKMILVKDDETCTVPNVEFIPRIGERVMYLWKCNWKEEVIEIEGTVTDVRHAYAVYHHIVSGGRLTINAGDQCTATITVTLE